MQYYLCGQTGNVNRGCEAIVRSTVKILGVKNGKIHLATYAPNMDSAMVRELGINMVSYNSYPTFIHQIVCAVGKRFFKSLNIGTKYKMRSLCAEIKKGDVVLNIGGDTYCYGRPELIMAFNKFAEKNKIHNYLFKKKK